MHILAAVMFAKIGEGTSLYIMADYSVVDCGLAGARRCNSIMAQSLPYNPAECTKAEGYCLYYQDCCFVAWTKD
jgi:hypothetical protein